MSADALAAPPEARRGRQRLAVLAALRLALIALSLLMGRYPGPYWTAPGALREGLLAQRLILNLRLPRVLSAVVVGMVLSASGGAHRAAHRPAPAAIDVRGVSFRYGPTAPPALDGVSVAIQTETVTAILGPNGSGKSTLLHVVLGLLSPERGEVRLYGRPLVEHSRREASRLLGLVPQTEHVTFDLSVSEYALLGRAPYLGLLETPGPEDRACARRALEAAGIEARARRRS